MTNNKRLVRTSRKQSIIGIEIEPILTNKEDIQTVKANRLKAIQSIIENEMINIRKILEQKTNEYYHLSNEINSLI